MRRELSAKEVVKLLYPPRVECRGGGEVVVLQGVEVVAAYNVANIYSSPRLSLFIAQLFVCETLPITVAKVFGCGIRIVRKLFGVRAARHFSIEAKPQFIKIKVFFA